MKVLVTGGRTYTNIRFLHEMLDKLNAERPITLIMSGNASGADSLARSWAMLRKKPYVGYPAPWKLYGDAAGPIRNTRMLEEGRPDIVVAFRGFTGTADMVKKTKAKGVKLLDYRDHD